MYECMYVDVHIQLDDTLLCADDDVILCNGDLKGLSCDSDFLLVPIIIRFNIDCSTLYY